MTRSGCSSRATHSASRFATVPDAVRWPRCCGRPNIAAICATASFSISAVAGPPSSAWLFGLSSIAVAYATAMLLNPNNHALDGGPATAEMEKDAVAQIAAMFGLPQHLGHLTASGTVANLEALWVARELHPDRVILSGANAHYTHGRVSAVLNAKHETVPEDDRGRIDLDALADRLQRGGVGTVVATPGTPGLGAVDDVAAIADLCAAHGARLHV